MCEAGVNLPSLGNQVPDPVLPGGELVSTDPPDRAGPRPTFSWSKSAGPSDLDHRASRPRCVRTDPRASVQTPGASIQTTVHLYRPPGRTDTRAPRHPFLVPRHLFLVPLHPREGHCCHLPTGLPPREDADLALKVVSVPLRGAQADLPLKHRL